MMTKNIKIGEVVCKYTYLDETRFGDTLSQYVTDQPHDYEITVKIDHHITPKALYTIKRGKEAFYFDKKIEVVSHFKDESQDEIIEQLYLDLKKKTIDIFLNPLYVENLSQQSYVLSGVAFMQIAELEGYVPFHASAISYDNQAIVFSAPSGTGKSTQRKLWETYLDHIEVINDDKPMFYKKGRSWLVGSLPFSGKSMLSKDISVPLKAIVFLKQAPTPKLTKLTNVQSIKLMLENTYRPMNKNLYHKLLDHLIDIERTHDIYLLEATKEKDTFNLLFNTLFKGDTYED